MITVLAVLLDSFTCRVGTWSLLDVLVNGTVDFTERRTFAMSEFSPPFVVTDDTVAGDDGGELVADAAAEVVETVEDDTDDCRLI